MYEKLFVKSYLKKTLYVDSSLCSAGRKRDMRKLGETKGW